MPPFWLYVPVKSILALSVNVPPLTVNGPLTFDAPFTVRLPLFRVMPSLATIFPATAVPAMETTGLASGPRSIHTASDALGTVPPLQLLAVVQAPLESVSHTLGPLKTVPRCKNAFLPAVPCTNVSGADGGTTVANEPLMAPPEVMIWNKSPTFATKPPDWMTLTVPPSVTVPVTCMES